MERDIKSLISQMTLEEKASLCSGLDNWHTKPIERLGIPSIRMSDGPHGLRKEDENSEEEILKNSIPSTCFPTAATTACSWDRELIKQLGKALAEECQAEEVDIILGPAINIKRSPLCGRNFEYFSEDPYLSGQLATAYIQAVQSLGVGTSLKHYAANNQEHRRFTIDEIIDERTLREIYLTNFEGPVKEGNPWTVMCSYNRINGTLASENRYTLTDILRNEWGFEGFVVSDWGAVNERVEAIKAGLDLEMPSSYGIGDKKIVEAVKRGELDEKILDQTVERLLKIIFKAIENRKENATYNKEEHHKLARKIATESIVLLKNQDNILPLKKEGTIAIIGGFAKNPRYQGGGSSHVNPTKLDNALEEIEKIVQGKANVLYEEGYSLETDEMNQELIEKAKETAKKSDVAIIFAGLPERYESEGYDRTHMKMPENHNKLIEEVTKVQPNTIVVLSNGSPVEMPWVDKVKGIIESYLGGQAGAGAVADILFGEVNPSGKLAETFPKKLSHNPSYLNFPGEGNKVEYREGVFVGYRYYDKKEIEPLFPFGYGLSYTTFEYTDITVDKKEITDKETIEVKVKVKNTGKVKGKEIVQLYVKDIESTLNRPEKELKGFEKIELEPGEEKTVTFTLDKRAFAYYNTEIKDWHVESGEFEILVGRSSKDIELKETVKLNSTVTIKKKYDRNSTIGDLMEDPTGAQIIDELIQKLSKVGGMFSQDDHKSNEMVLAMIKYMPLRGLINFGKGQFTEEMLEEIHEKVNK
ncbi:glycoside hydrolase family 3 C-terminal domain-containing protein [Petrotoga sp. 9PWA.NaAc.5.4]|uniref:glycoside hydrolase family 3 C-terminal domain-containing protein n=1 Tax=Petrotoga sp. 9PWA.NaAc.5.4 TaxID=1434328 RepID=UPI000CC1159E|nr:glycoside hydrolase family 3 C-terminal domain-containing protein [Petrotoga sp. 9PWA.NaAc.5.4]PNR96217.1 glycosyl hydrolase family 3 [Petrotoga sp. 9PWA.NaAc.5.4]